MSNNVWPEVGGWQTAEHDHDCPIDGLQYPYFHAFSRVGKMSHSGLVSSCLSSLPSILKVLLQLRSKLNVKL